MSAMGSQITGVSIAFSTDCSDADQRKHQSYASLAFVREIYRWPVDSLHRAPVPRKVFPFDGVIMRRFEIHAVTSISMPSDMRLDRKCTVPGNIYLMILEALYAHPVFSDIPVAIIAGPTDCIELLMCNWTTIKYLMFCAFIRIYNKFHKTKYIKVLCFLIPLLIVHFMYIMLLSWHSFFTRGLYGHRVLSLPASVCPSGCQSLACPRDNSRPDQASITKFEP